MARKKPLAKNEPRSRADNPAFILAQDKSREKREKLARAKAMVMQRSSARRKLIDARDGE
jgi:hypothetical protein